MTNIKRYFDRNEQYHANEANAGGNMNFLRYLNGETTRQYLASIRKTEKSFRLKSSIILDGAYIALQFKG